MIKGFEELKLKDNLPKRMRYYQGMIDLNILEKGENYKNLKRVLLYLYAHLICSD